MIHATGRAIERLRWPARGFVKYVCPVGELACGAKLDRKYDGFFRAEDARALLQGKKTSRLLSNDDMREYAMPTCQECAVLVDQAFEKPFIIHTTIGTLKNESNVGLMTFCGERVNHDVPFLTSEDVDTKRRSAMWQPLFWPTCEVCKKHIQKMCGHDDAFLELF